MSRTSAKNVTDVQKQKQAARFDFIPAGDVQVSLLATKLGALEPRGLLKPRKVRHGQHGRLPGKVLRTSNLAGVVAVTRLAALFVDGVVRSPRTWRLTDHGRTVRGSTDLLRRLLCFSERNKTILSKCHSTKIQQFSFIETVQRTDCLRW